MVTRPRRSSTNSCQFIVSPQNCGPGSTLRLGNARLESLEHLWNPKCSFSFGLHEAHGTLGISLGAQVCSCHLICKKCIRSIWDFCSCYSYELDNKSEDSMAERIQRKVRLCRTFGMEGSGNHLSRTEKTVIKICSPLNCSPNSYILEHHVFICKC